jgi:hypothetical protein
MLLSEDGDVAVPFLDNFQHLAFQPEFHTIYPSVSGITINKYNGIILPLD